MNIFDDITTIYIFGISTTYYKFRKKYSNINSESYLISSDYEVDYRNRSKPSGVKTIINKGYNDEDE